MVKKYTVIDRIDAIVKWIILIIVGVFYCVSVFYGW